MCEPTFPEHLTVEEFAEQTGDAPAEFIECVECGETREDPPDDKRATEL